MKEAWGDDCQWDPWDRCRTAGAKHSTGFGSGFGSDWAETGGLALGVVVVGGIAQGGRVRTG